MRCAQQHSFNTAKDWKDVTSMNIALQHSIHTLGMQVNRAESSSGISKASLSDSYVAAHV